jgi:flavodoxin
MAWLPVRGSSLKIGIIVHSQTGHTLEVCERLKDRFAQQGHQVGLERVTVVGERTPQSKSFQLEHRPDPEPYEVVVFASYVEAFSLCQVMMRYMKGLGDMDGKPVACLLTQQLPYAWMGGCRALGQMKRICRDRGADPRVDAIVQWAKSKRAVSMSKALDALARSF